MGCLRAVSESGSSMSGGGQGPIRWDRHGPAWRLPGWSPAIPGHPGAERDILLDLDKALWVGSALTPTLSLRGRGGKKPARQMPPFDEFILLS
jgi:hypothetical protein